MRYLILVTLFFANTLNAEPLRVITTIPPIFGFTSDLMRGVAEPELIIDKGVDVHHFSLKPSQVAALSEADIIFAVGAEMEPWLEDIMPHLSAEIIFLAERTDPEHYLAIRELAAIGPSADDDHHDHNGDMDPHMWLDPVIAALWLQDISEVLATHDPENAAIYGGNAQAMIDNAQAPIDALAAIAAELAAVQLIVTHDSLQYLESRFELNIVGALSNAMDLTAGPRTLSGLMDIEGDLCILVDINEDTHDPHVLFPGLPFANFDPLGYDLSGKPNYLGNLSNSIASALENCLTAP